MQKVQLQHEYINTKKRNRVRIQQKAATRSNSFSHYSALPFPVMQHYFFVWLCTAHRRRPCWNSKAICPFRRTDSNNTIPQASQLVGVVATTQKCCILRSPVRGHPACLHIWLTIRLGLLVTAGACAFSDVRQSLIQGCITEHHMGSIKRAIKSFHFVNHTQEHTV